MASVNRSPRTYLNWATPTWCRSRTARCRLIGRSMSAPRWNNARRPRCGYATDLSPLLVGHMSAARPRVDAHTLRSQKLEAPMSSRDMAKFAAMRPYFEVVAEALLGLVNGTDFFDMHAEDVVVEYVITVPDYPRRIVGREPLAELYSDYGNSIVQSGSSEVHRYYDPDQSVVILEY